MNHGENPHILGRAWHFPTQPLHACGGGFLLQCVCGDHLPVIRCLELTLSECKTWYTVQVLGWLPWIVILPHFPWHSVDEHIGSKLSAWAFYVHHVRMSIKMLYRMVWKLLLDTPSAIWQSKNYLGSRNALLYEALHCVPRLEMNSMDGKKALSCPLNPWKKLLPLYYTTAQIEMKIVLPNPFHPFQETWGSLSKQNFQHHICHPRSSLVPGNQGMQYFPMSRIRQ